MLENSILEMEFASLHIVLDNALGDVGNINCSHTYVKHQFTVCTTILLHLQNYNFDFKILLLPQTLKVWEAYFDVIVSKKAQRMANWFHHHNHVHECFAHKITHTPDIIDRVSCHVPQSKYYKVAYQHLLSK